MNLLKRNGILIVLIKPQFEAKKNDVEDGGIIKNPLIHAKILGDFLNWTLNEKITILGLKKSKLLGIKGNKEFFLYLKKN
jgi:23S rRNA (cytidine1920-2'-O)/16S rRNA (cytidine1409-2'-O)-methyltransferase